MSLPSGFRPLALSTAIAAIVMSGLAPAISHADTRPASAPASSLAPAANSASSTAPARAEQASPVIKSENDQRLYRSLTLDNGLRVLLVSDAKADKAAAAVDVEVGSAQDPDDVPGLAHFLEHMLFLGTDRYPKPDAYQDFITKHGGQHNAFTASQDTNYFFDIDPDAFDEALPRFARFFVAPQFNADYVDRERHAVNSEYQARLQDDGRRIYEAVEAALNPQHPFNRFSVGSLETLKDTAAGSLRQRLVDFYQAHYGANVMRLSLVGPQSLETLEQLARDNFSDVPDRGLSRPEITTPLASGDELPARLEVKALKQERKLSFMFPIDDPIAHYRSQPVSYLANLIGHEGEGSLLAVLKDKGWADGLSAGGGLSDGEHALLSVDISLTPEGAQHQAEIRAALFDYLALIRAEGINDWRYTEQAQLGEQSFRFQQRSSPVNLASNLAMMMTRYPIEDVLAAPYLMQDFDPDLIKDTLARLTPDNLLEVYSGPQVEGDQQGEWFKAPYTLTRLTADAAAQTAGDDTLASQLALPRPNPYLAKDFRVLDLADAKPSQLIDEPGAELWYQGDASFGVPKAEWRFGLLNPDVSRSVDDQAMSQVLAAWLNDSLNARLYPARLAGQDALVYAHGRGITLQFSGWRDGQQPEMREVLDQLVNGEMAPATLERITQRLRRSLQNRVQAPLYTRLGRSLSETLVGLPSTAAQQLAALDKIDAQSLDSFRKRFLAKLHVQAMVTGNLTADQARETGQLVINGLAPRITREAVPDLEVRQVTQHTLLRPDSTRGDAGALRYLQGKDRTLQSQARIAVLGQLLEAPFYSQLRTEEQLGYIVSARYSPMLDAPGLSLLVQSPSKDSKTLFSRMDAFLTRFDSRVQSLDEAALASYRDAVVDSLTQKPRKLSELAARNWSELSFGWTGFDRRQQLVAAVEQVSAQDIRAIWQQLNDSSALELAFDPGTPSDFDQRLTELDLPPLPEAPRAETGATLAAPSAEASGNAQH
ncbi:insulinase family protein [Cobetia sp. 4B]|uniref:insulinase family protein n=1 Tax=Cobetia sp. 4B TaxID=2758724 RepID=UPI001C05B1F6|nr:insulinase family protein [Cobetia sp. 4B]MBR9756325.1 peptidase M16 [Gammaproteobacteria bacterium]QWN36733.1 insulinase family protein [Cobetia sp. 4B]